jgi:hypothetical protein
LTGLLIRLERRRLEQDAIQRPGRRGKAQKQQHYEGNAPFHRLIKPLKKREILPTRTNFI